MARRYNQKFWLERYLNENEIKEWFKNYVSFYSEKPTLEYAVNEFIEGEKEEIEEIFTSLNNRVQAYNNVVKVMKDVKEWCDYENI